jgi:hypothetical protein
MASRDSTAPRGLPGRLIMIVVARIPATARDKIARGVFFAPSERMCSPKPGMSLSTTAIVASGVTSRGPTPVPPVVRITSASLASAVFSRSVAIAARSSGKTCEDTTCQRRSLQRAMTAGPEQSSDFPLLTESLIVTTATRMAGFTMNYPSATSWSSLVV